MRKKKGRKRIQKLRQYNGDIFTHTLKDKITPGSKTAPDFIITSLHTIACFSTQPSSIVTLSHIQEPSIETFDPIVHLSPITEFEIFVLSPILVPFPMMENGPICAERDCPISKKNQVDIIKITALTKKQLHKPRD